MTEPRRGYTDEESAPLVDAASRHSDDDNGTLPALGRRQSLQPARDPLHTIVLYGLNALLLLGGLICAALGWLSVVRGHFKDKEKADLLDMYSIFFQGFNRLGIFMALDLVWVVCNLVLALKGSQRKLYYVNFLWDLNLVGVLITFGVFTLIQALENNDLCYSIKDDESRLCTTDADSLITVEITCISFCFAAGIIHFMLFTDRCFNIGQASKLREAYELDMYLDLGRQKIHRMREERDRLLAETAALEQRRLQALGGSPVEVAVSREESVADLAGSVPGRPAADSLDLIDVDGDASDLEDEVGNHPGAADEGLGHGHVR